jgi:cell division protein FtsB
MNKFINYIGRKKKLIISLIIAIALLSIIIFSSHGLITRIGLEIDNSAYRDKIVGEKFIRDSIIKRIEQLKTDITEVERIARENFGMIKPGDVVYFIKDTDSVKTNPKEGD